MVRIALGVLFIIMGSAMPATTVAAQTAGPASGITTIGTGIASAPADSMVLHLVFTGEDYYGGPPQAPVVEATPGASARASMDPIVTAITAIAGVESVETIVPAPIGDLGRPAPTARLDVTIAAPTSDLVTGIVNDAARAASEQRLLIGYIGGYTEIADCTALEEQARQAAVDDATTKAGIQADVIGATLGAPTSVRDIPSELSLNATYYGLTTTPANSCAAPALAQGTLEFGVIGPTFDPVTQQPVVEVLRTVEVTFALDGAAATPAS